ncbi:LacI family DNA-binding transcriptional regulator [Nocardioides sp.]|uniref:LacI family DNA-binding transcriptional regulator n=1 Tax=Nocardioides sp. TaxID=35761 RepID=UPI0019A29E13|nr:LacI family DNA-binding transcriptional regulator [Nocardioides sp.]MBC7276385.1 LacI family DNA-binding transcriptional regulator [Nocardioides sp.]
MTRGPRRATVKDVAALAGVSPKTVSNVVTGTVFVRPDTREKVLAAVEELRFVPNLSARSLRNGRTGVIALALPDLATAFSADMLHRVVQVAHERGMAVLIEETAAEPQREYDLVSRAREHQIDGLILNPIRLKDSIVVHDDQLPPVVLIGEVEQHKVDRVLIDSRQAGYEVTAHLLERGAKRVAVLGGETGATDATATSIQRLEGHHRALRDHGIEPDPAIEVYFQEWSMVGGAAAAEELLSRDAGFDAIMAFTDSIAFGAMHVLQEHGLSVPGDVLVSGFDDVEHARFMNPSLTTVALDRRAFAEAAVDLLMTRIEDRATPPRAVAVPHELVIRGSTTR